MSVKKTAQGTYRARVRDHTGRQITKTFRLKGDATNWERDQLVARAKGELVSGGRITVAEFAEVWLASARDLSPNTLATYRKSLAHILPVLGDVQLARLTPELIDEFINQALEAGKSPNTVKRAHTTLSRMCNVAIERKRLHTNPCLVVRPPKVPKAVMRFLSVDQVEALADTIHPRYRAFVLVAAYGGLRWGELRALRPGHFDGSSLTVFEQFGGADVKTQASKRRVALPASVAAELAAHIERYPGEYIFTNSVGEPMTHSSFSSYHFKPALVAAGIDRATRIHDLRHTCASLLIAAGVNAKVVSEQLGHANIGITMDTYTHLFPAAFEQAAAALDQLRNG